MKKRSSVKIIVLALIITVLTVCEILYIGNHKTISSDEQIGCTAETLSETDGYSTDGNTFTKSSNNAFFSINDSLMNTEKVNIFFDNPLREGTEITVYGKHDPTASEKKIASTVTKEKSKSCYLDVEDGTYALLKFVVDTNSFTLKEITVAGENKQNNYLFIVLFSLLFLGLDVFIVLRIVQVWRKEKNAGHRLNKKEYMRTLVLFLSVFLVMAETELFFVYSNLTHYDIMGASPNTLLETDGYDINTKYVSEERNLPGKHGAKKELIPQDPYATFTVRNTLCETDYIAFYFSDPLTDNATMKIYCQEDPGIDDTPVQIYQLTKEKKQQRFELPTGSYKTLKIHIDIPVTLERIEVYGEKYIGIFLNSLYIILSLLAVTFTVLWSFDKLYILTTIPTVFVSLKPFRLYDAFSEKVYTSLSQKITIEKFFVIMALVMGITFSFLIPVSQVPDETSHMRMMSEAIGLDNGEQIYDKLVSVTDSSFLGPPFSERQDLEDYLQGSGTPLDRSTIQYTPRFTKRILWYFPSAAGLALGILCNLPFFWCMHLAELCSLVFYVLVCYKALQVIPVSKHLLCAIMLLPMSIQQGASINYDSILLPLSFFVTAYILSFRYKDKMLSWKNMLLILGVLCVIGIIKPPYILLGLLLFLVPFSKYNLYIKGKNIVTLIRKYKYPLIAVVIILIGIGLYLKRENTYVQIMLAFARDLPGAFQLFANTLLSKTSIYTSQITGGFGWLDVHTSAWYTVYLIIMLLLLARTNNRSDTSGVLKIETRDRFVSLLLFLCVSVLIIISMIPWSIALQRDIYSLSANEHPIHGYLSRLDLIEGVQGRYFIPILFLFFFGISLPVTIKKSKMLLPEAIYYGISFIYPVIILLDRYWISIL